MWITDNPPPNTSSQKSSLDRCIMNAVQMLATRFAAFTEKKKAKKNLFKFIQQYSNSRKYATAKFSLFTMFSFNHHIQTIAIPTIRMQYSATQSTHQCVSMIADPMRSVPFNTFSLSYCTDNSRMLLPYKESIKYYYIYTWRAEAASVKQVNCTIERSN